MNNFKTLNENFKSFLQQENEGDRLKAGDKVKDLDSGSVGTVVEPMAGGATVELEDGTLVKLSDKSIEKVEGEMSDEERMAMYDDEHLSDLDIYQESADKSEPKQGDDVVVTAGGLAGAAGEVMELTTSTEGEPAVVIYLRKDAKMKVMGKAGDEVIALVSDVQVDSGIQGGEDSMEPEDDYNWVGHKAHYQESDNKEEYNGQLWENKIDKIINKIVKEYGDHETQAQGGMVSSSQSSDPELDQIADIVRTVIEGGGSLHDLKQPLEAEAFDVQATNRFIIVKTTNGDVGIASAKNVELAGDEELVDTPYGQLAVGRINQGMEEGEVNERSKDDDDDLEEPVKYPSGAVLEWNPKLEQYYDRSRDMYLDNKEAARLTMENKQMKLKNVDLREKVKSSVMQKLKEMYDDDEYGEDPYMAGLEAEFPWMKDKKKGGKMTPADAAAAEAAAAADAAAAGEFEVAPEDEEDPTITMREGNFAEYGKIDAEDGNPPSKIGQGDEAYMAAYNAVLVARGEDPLPVMQPDQAYLDALQSGSMKPEDHSYNMEEGEEVDFAEALRSRVTKRLQELSKGQEELDLDDDGKIEPEDLAGLRAGKEDEDVGEEAEKNESLRDKVYRIVQETLNEEEHDDDKDEEEVEEGKDKFVYATDKKRAESEKNAKDARDAYKPKDKDEDDEEKNEGKMKYSREEDDKEDSDDEEKNEGKYKREDDPEDDDKKEIEEGGMKYSREDDKDSDDKEEEVEENIAANPEDFFRKLRNESRQVANESSWNDSHRSKRSSMLNERLMDSWFNKKSK